MREVLRPSLAFHLLAKSLSRNSFPFKAIRIARGVCETEDLLKYQRSNRIC